MQYSSQDGRGGYGTNYYDSIGHITRAEAAYNQYYGQNKQGVFCQELGHTFGQDHSPYGCMGYTYYSGAPITTVQHNRDDIYSWYRYQHVH